MEISRSKYPCVWNENRKHSPLHTQEILCMVIPREWVPCLNLHGHSSLLWYDIHRYTFKWQFGRYLLPGMHFLRLTEFSRWFIQVVVQVKPATSRVLGKTQFTLLHILSGLMAATAQLSSTYLCLRSLAQFQEVWDGSLSHYRHHHYHYGPWLCRGATKCRVLDTATMSFLLDCSRWSGLGGLVSFARCVWERRHQNLAVWTEKFGKHS